MGFSGRMVDIYLTPPVVIPTVERILVEAFSGWMRILKTQAEARERVVLLKRQLRARRLIDRRVADEGSWS